MATNDSPPRFVGDDWMIAWTSAKRAGNNHTIEVGPWPDRARWSDKYDSTTGCCDIALHDLTPQQRAQRLVNEFWHLVLVEGLDPAAVNREFWKIKCYREMTIDLCNGAGWVAFYKGEPSPHNP